MMKPLKKISLMALLIPFLVSPIKDTKEIFYEQINPKKVQKLRLKTSDYERYYKDISPLIDYIEEKGFQINNLLRNPRFEIYKERKNLFSPPKRGERPSLEEYKKRLGYEDKKDKISDFIDKNIEQLKSAEEIYGISRYIISAIIGIESDFGNNLGSFNPFNTYFSMYAYNYKKDFAKNQLEELLIFCEKKDIDVFNLKSSHAGAMTPAQFIPSSLNSLFIGEDLYDMDNSILSVANYLSHSKKITKNLEKVIFSYNRNSLYVRTVLDLAKDAEENFSRE